MMITSTFGLTTDPTLAELAETCGEAVEFPRGHVIFAQGEPGSELYIIQSGKVKIGKKRPDGRENLLAVLGPSEAFGELNLFDPGQRDATATTVTETRAIAIDCATFKAWIIARPELTEHMLRYLARSVRRVRTRLSDQILIDVPARLAKVLLQLAERFGTHESGRLRVTHDLTQEELAQLIGASRETVNKVLADFVARGWLRVEGKSVLILDADRLARRAR